MRPVLLLSRGRCVHMVVGPPARVSETNVRVNDGAYRRGQGKGSVRGVAPAIEDDASGHPRVAGANP